MSDNKTKLFSPSSLALYLLLTLAAIFRFYHLGYKGLWGDEIWTASWSQAGLLHILRGLTRPPDMPILYMLVHLTTRISSSEFWVRFPSAFFGVVAVYYLYRLTCIWLGERVALIASLLLAISPLHIWYSQDARYYSLLSALSLATVTYFFLVLTHPKRQWHDWILLVLSALLSIYTHLFSVWYLLSLALFAFISIFRRSPWSFQGHTSKQKQIRPLLGAGIIILLFSMPVLWLILRVLQTGIGPTGEHLARFTFPPTLPFFFNFNFLQEIGMLFAGGTTLQWLMIPLFFLGWLRLYWDNRNAWWFLLLLVLSPLITSLFVEFLHNVTVKYFVYLLPFFLMMVANGINAIPSLIGAITHQENNPTSGTKASPDRLSLSTIVPLLLILGGLHLQPLQMLYRQAKVNDWRSVAHFLDSQIQPGDIILTEKWGRAALNYYLTRSEDVEIIPVRDRDWRQIIDSTEGTIWFVGLKGKAEQQIAQLWAPIDDEVWRDQTLIYEKPKNAKIFFPVTETDKVVVFNLQEGIPSRYDFMAVTHAAWTDRSYSEIPPKQSRRLRLMRGADRLQQLQLSYLDQKGRDLELYLDDTLLGTLIGGANGGAWQTATWSVPENASDIITVTLQATGSRNAVVDRIELWGEDTTTTLPGSTPKQPSSPASPPHTVWIVGDSLTRGLFASSEQSTFRNLLFAKLQALYPGAIQSTFWAGTCTLAGLEQSWKNWPGQPDILFIELGINDLGGNRQCPRLPDEKWQAHYGDTLDQIRQKYPKITIVVGTVPWSGWHRQSDEFNKALQFNEWIRKEAQKRNVAVADLWTATLDRRDGLSTPDQKSVFPPYYHGDNFHPNDVGHQRLADTFFDAYLSTLTTSQAP
ncbi:MAG: hypothetical protein GXP38_06730 [Chloroflexi bacterium]|nr:hypothetical protein [Chloroflexota bacterium]